MEWLKCRPNKNEDSVLDDSSCIIESKCIYNFCNNYDSMVNEVAISSILNIIDVIPILKQVYLVY